MEKPKPAQLKAYFAAIQAIHEAIVASGEKGIPEGHLYAHVMSMMSLSTFESMIKILVESKRITNNGHLLVAVKETP